MSGRRACPTAGSRAWFEGRAEGGAEGRYEGGVGHGGACQGKSWQGSSR
jgi:hypothetical protein